MNVKNLVFFNHWRNGDCFINRNYVKEIMSLFPNSPAYYAHNNHTNIIHDLNCSQIRIDSIPRQVHMNLRLAYDQSENLYINTWIGAYKGDLFHEPHHANFVILHKAWKFVYDNIGIKINDDYMQYHPTVDYSKFDLSAANAYIHKIENKKLILFCNGQQMSGQSSMGNMTNAIQTIATEYSDYEFLVCDKVNVTAPNVTFTDDIFGGTSGNLNHISYLSTFADLIIGKNSGPFSYSHVRENMDNPKKTFLCFSRDMVSTLMGDGKYYANALFSNTINDRIATDIIRNVINNTPYSNELKASIQL